MKNLYFGVKGVLKNEGIISLFKRGFLYLLKRFIMFEEYYIVTVDYKDVDKENEVDYLPKIGDYSWKAISTNKEADELVASGYDFGAYELNIRDGLDKGAVSICIFIGKEFGHISCFADNPRGKAIVDPRPFNVDFQGGEIVAGKALTAAKFQNLHLRTYGAYILRAYNRNRGIRGARYTVKVNNYQAMVFGKQITDRKVISKNQYLKILWYKNLKETRIDSLTLKQVYERGTKS